MALQKNPIMVLLLFGLLQLIVVTKSENTTIQGCPQYCGSVKIPYPFGYTKGCYYNTSFQLTCNQTFNPPKPFFQGSNVTILEIILEDGELLIESPIARDCYDKRGKLMENESNQEVYTISFSQFPLSTRNKFITVGCDTVGVVVGGGNSGRLFVTGCIAFCNKTNDVVNGSCEGIGCCQMDIPKDVWDFGTISGPILNNHAIVHDFNPCGYAFVAQEGSYNFSKLDLVNLKKKNTSRVVLDLTIGNFTCEQAKVMDDYACRAKNSKCLNSSNYGPGYRCKCLDGFKGNPYLLDGCGDINECLRPINPCQERWSCENLIGSFKCSCLKGFKGDGKINGTGCTPIDHTTSKFYLNEFQQKATLNYDQSRVIGQGGYGTVYKGILTCDKIVAIKKSKISNTSQIEQFINEVIVLSQINHRNVVKLIGCCLESEVPLLVYEYITNGTLSDHLFDKLGKYSSLSWKMRLNIATETASAIAYFHSSISMAIIHRDIKTANILLDENCIAKVSDFGASRLVPVDQTQLTTLVQGTLGYLDPEYFHTSQLTEKSDVYSFGVVLAELLTGQKALSFERPEGGINLALHFISSMKEDRLLQILDKNMIIVDEDIEAIKVVANLAKWCLRVRGEERPSMKEVASELEGLIHKEIHPWGPNSNNNQEDMNVEETKYLLESSCLHAHIGSSNDSSPSVVVLLDGCSVC
ncbi:hypothetical protein G4B88_027822 [Cannabis sativa]|uniref:Uncharacterized protein n=1 Tax=Cannabis sativa TaxID=3483 RepID=A0A7J6DM46_CANSA|nr:hypothetical protein G4B88_027822 [Cannabis sativa]